MKKITINAENLWQIQVGATTILTRKKKKNVGSCKKKILKKGGQKTHNQMKTTMHKENAKNGHKDSLWKWEATTPISNLIMRQWTTTWRPRPKWTLKKNAKEWWLKITKHIIDWK